MASEAKTATPDVVDAEEENYEVHPKFLGDDIEFIARYLMDNSLARIGGVQPEVAIVCGTGLSHLSERVANKVTLPYDTIPRFPQSTVRGHAGELVFGDLGGKRVAMARGRFHYYEGYSPSKVGSLIRVFAAIGCRVLIVTNAAGGVNSSYSVGDIAMIDDHIFFPGVGGQHPLVGTNDDRFGVRFPPMSRAYDEKLQLLATTAARDVGAYDKLRQGAVYACVCGPSYETPHEIEMLRTLGCDQVGMSTIQEVVVARHCNLRVLGLSVITNKCLGPDDDRSIQPTHTEVVDAGRKAGAAVQALVQKFLERLDMSTIPPTRAGVHFAELVKTPPAATSEEEPTTTPAVAAAPPPLPTASAAADGGCCSGGKCECSCKCPEGGPSAGGHSTTTVLVAAAVSAITAAIVAKFVR